MNKNKYLLLGSSLGVLALLIVAAAQEGFREWRVIQRATQSDEGPLGVRLRQVVSPGLGTSDRCVSCHVGMDPSEQGVRGGRLMIQHADVVHDTSEFGCTVCHSGQGLATEKLDAHGEVRFWPEPMIPLQFSQAGCGTCHASLGMPGLEAFRQARGAFERLDCLACHRVDGRGGTMRPDGFGMEGPDLSRVGLSGYDQDWYSKHLLEWEKAQSGSWKAAFAPIGEQDLRLISTYLSTRIGAAKLAEAKVHFLSNGCLGCHRVSGFGGDEGPELTRAGEKDPGQVSFAQVQGKHTLTNWFSEHFRSPASLVADSLMPAVDVSDEEIELLTMYTLSLRRRELPGTYVSKERMRVEKLGEREFASDGQTIFSAVCAGCHGKKGEGKQAPGRQVFPAIANPDFLALASDEFIFETINQGRPGRKMPSWGTKEAGLKKHEISRAAEYLRKMGGVEAGTDSKPRRWVSGNSSEGKRLFASACSTCHGAEGQGKEGPALNNKALLAIATDTYLVETISGGRRRTLMEGFLTPSMARPTLSPAEIEDVVAYIRSWEGVEK